MSANGRAVVAKRCADPPVTTQEIERLAAAAGYEVVATATQTRPEDGRYNLGPGKAKHIVETVEETDASTLIVDNDLTPAQTKALADLTPRSTTVVDRYRLVLEIFADGVGDQRAATQVELTRLEYELPRIRDQVGQRDGGLSKFTEKGTPLQDVETRIEMLRTRLADLTDQAAERRRRRRAAGFDLVALAGYTNAGKSTLLHRLADELSLDEYGTAHDDIEETAAIEDRLFRTLETTSRRATIDDRQCIVTDTVGLLDAVPHDLIESFDATLSEATDADLTVVVADASDDPDTFTRRVETAVDVLSDADRRLVALNKVDQLTDAELDERVDALPASVTDSVPVSATTGDLHAFERRIDAALPSYEERTVTLPQGGDTERFLAWLYDHATVDTTVYEGGSVTVTYSGRPSIVDQAAARAPTTE